MVWLIGAIATYGIVTLLIGIAVLVYLIGDKAPAGEAMEADARPAPQRHPITLGPSRRNAVPRIRLIGAR